MAYSKERDDSTKIDRDLELKEKVKIRMEMEQLTQEPEKKKKKTLIVRIIYFTRIQRWLWQLER